MTDDIKTKQRPNESHTKSGQTNQVTTQTVPIELLDNHPGNYNRHSPEQINSLRQSLRYFDGQVETIVVQAKGDGRYLIVAGHGVTEAARLENFAELEARVVPESWPPEKVKAYMLASNEHARNSQRDDLQFLSILEELQAYDETAVSAAGVGDDEFEALMKQFSVDDGVQMKELKVQKPPKMAWALVGVPVVEYGRVAGQIESLASDTAVIVETTVSDK